VPEVSLRSASALTERLYARSTALLDAASARPRALALGGLPVAFAAILVINRFVLLDFPNSGDEYAYLYQALTLAEGRLWNPPSPAPDLLAFNYIVHEPDRSFGSFPMGWPLVLATVLAAGGPAWLVNPLLGLTTLVLLHAVGTRLYDRRTGVAAAVLVGASPFFLFNAASYFSHTFCGAALLGATWFAAREDRRPAWVPLAVGALIGWAVVARYFTGVVCGVPIAWWLLRPGAPRMRTLAWLAVGGLPWLVALLAYNQAMTGDAWQLTTRPLTLSLWFADGVVLRGADILATHVVRHLSWTPAVFIIAYVVYLRRAPAGRRGALDWMLVATAATLYFYVERGGNQYGPRFHYEAFLFLALFVTAQIFRGQPFATRSATERGLFGGLVVSVAALPLALATHAVIERRVIDERSDVYSDAMALGAAPALVLISSRVGSVRSMGPADLTRNGLWLEAPVLFAVDPGEGARCAAGARLNRPRVYTYVWNDQQASGSLAAVPCPALAVRQPGPRRNRRPVAPRG
jgi:hypothetical protein